MAIEYKPCRPLKADEVELRVGNTAKNYKKCVVLIYKTARIDMEMLDTMFGAGNWRNDYKEIKDVMYCGIAVRFENEWVWRWNAGVESKGTGDDDPNNKKGEASDAFKRAGFLWGIGRELYKWKELEIPLKDEDFWIFDKGTDKERRKLKTEFTLAKLEYNEDGSPKELIIIDQDLNERYRYTAPTGGESKEPPKKTEPSTSQEESKYSRLQKVCAEKGKSFDLVIKKIAAKYNKKVNELSKDEWESVYIPMQDLPDAPVPVQ